MSKIKKIVLAALLLGILIVLSRFLSIKTPIIRISFGYVPIMLSAIWLGPKWSTLIAGLGDLIGALLFPSGTFFPGYTLSSVLSGFIYGIILYKKEGKEYSNKQFVIRLIISVLLVVVFVNGLLNTLWVYITSSSAASVIVPIRVVKQLVMFPIQVITIFILEKALRKPFDKYIRSGND